MPRRMIPVRNKTTGQEALVSERAFPLFAASHERLDHDTPTDATEAASPDASPAVSSPAPQATTPKPQRRGAATDDKE
ncbi:hypothetical protein Ssi03_50500 [Sphaerisporangium siamense]|uniref:Uncharacterized protein n=1 Tax=Sphaerisporangium siamense TaxID=795645 RepID=A0A7W7DAY0_9ACTN|nr:hypothetical protein [Sphaerisporangium siamense]MBB4702246.1 hypothetical protein [Sphaerisporangium siamense]GII87060.1 hypothetical protein Ssi03_50500 [Sphaerisporangium siamense]